jgi:hypothetical protein
MRSSIASFGSRCAFVLVALAVAGGAIGETYAQAVDKDATNTPGVNRAPVLRSDARVQQPAAKNTRHLAGSRPQGSLHRYYQEQSRAQAARVNGAPSSRRVLLPEIENNGNVSIASPFSDEARPSVVTPPDALEGMRPLDPDAYVGVQEAPVVAPPPPTSL